MNFFRSVLIFLFFSYLCADAQETTFPLTTNPALKKFTSDHTNRPLQRTASNVTLPFIDDFSRTGIYPQSDLWSDSNVFINSNYPDDPVTIGVATFDGLDQWGNPYDINAILSDKADYLTSNGIDLSPYSLDTTVWFSFFYQPQGLGDAPESGDSLVLQFLDNSGTWNNIWSVSGRPDTAFQRVSIRVTGSNFLFNGFKFRFFNYATINGNRDHWHIDYVILKANSTLNDPIRDNGFIRPQYSLLKDFESMPYTHYSSISNPLSEMATTVVDSVRNINYGPTSYTYVSTVSDENGNQLNASTPSTLSGNSNSIIAFSTALNGFTFPSSSALRAEFQLKNYVSITGTQSNLYNDTVSYRQVFDNYYAYDDGSAEIGYGVTGNTGVKLAYEFDVRKTDTLRAIDIYFNPTGVNVSTTLFQLSLWDQISVAGNSENLVYRQINQRPKNIDSINGFARYVFDTLLVVQPGSIWVGFTQNTPSILIGVGLDKNTDHHTKMYYHVDGRWYNSTVRGSWMMRPVFGDTLGGVIGIDEPVSGLMFDIYPQPADHGVRIGHSLNQPLTYSIYGLLGEIVASGKLEDFIPTEELPKGLYLLKIISADGKKSGTRRLMIQR